MSILHALSASSKVCRSPSSHHKQQQRQHSEETDSRAEEEGLLATESPSRGPSDDEAIKTPLNLRSSEGSALRYSRHPRSSSNKRAADKKREKQRQQALLQKELVMFPTFGFLQLCGFMPLALGVYLLWGWLGDVLQAVATALLLALSLVAFRGERYNRVVDKAA
ncbi:hypothetical protein cyc_08245 [Cyclospora cayetanensis]|uniref:Transmembrane protein n=1 Tax=Cyclospora cayetanensis TaxID=88456 RepID=A0A1D3CST0_9EIME|nr:hypothetical protein cyc_08245 [Cyclospora cayetanensis]